MDCSIPGFPVCRQSLHAAILLISSWDMAPESKKPQSFTHEKKFALLGHSGWIYNMINIRTMKYCTVVEESDPPEHRDSVPTLQTGPGEAWREVGLPRAEPGPRWGLRTLVHPVAPPPCCFQLLSVVAVTTKRNIPQRWLLVISVRISHHDFLCPVPEEKGDPVGVTCNNELGWLLWLFSLSAEVRHGIVMEKQIAWAASCVFSHYVSWWSFFFF